MRNPLARRSTDSALVAVARRRTGKLAACGLWLVLGVYAVWFAAAPYSPSPEQEARYNELMDSALYSPEYSATLARLEAVQYDFNEVNVWFWRWRPAYTARRQELAGVLAVAQAEFDSANAVRNSIISDAKSTVGIWSPAGVAEARSTFWSDFRWGSGVAQRASWYDTFFTALENRDDGVVVLVFRVLINFTLGFVMALIRFVLSVWGLLWTYQTSWLSSLLFFAVALAASSAVVTLVIGLIWGTVVGATVGAVMLVASSSRLQSGAPRGSLHND